MSDRPVEPCCTNENPEQWAAIAEWEAERADRLLEESKRERKITDKYIRHLHDMQSQRDRLRDAIEKHRRDMWGNGPVGHLYDKNLYIALQEDRDDK